MVDLHASFTAEFVFSTSGQMFLGISFDSTIRRCCKRKQKANFKNGICPDTIASLSTFISLIRCFLWNYGGLPCFFHSQICLQYIRPNVFRDFLQKYNEKVLHGKNMQTLKIIMVFAPLRLRYSAPWVMPESAAYCVDDILCVNYPRISACGASASQPSGWHPCGAQLTWCDMWERYRVRFQEDPLFLQLLK